MTKKRLSDTHHIEFPCHQVRFSQPARAITPGQALVLYDGDVCLGASVIVYPGPSLFEQDHKNLSKASVG